MDIRLWTCPRGAPAWDMRASRRAARETGLRSHPAGTPLLCFIPRDEAPQHRSPACRGSRERGDLLRHQFPSARLPAESRAGWGCSRRNAPGSAVQIPFGPAAGEPGEHRPLRLRRVQRSEPSPRSPAISRSGKPARQRRFRLRVSRFDHTPDAVVHRIGQRRRLGLVSRRFDRAGCIEVRHHDRHPRQLCRTPYGTGNPKLLPALPWQSGLHAKRLEQCFVIARGNSTKRSRRLVRREIASSPRSSQ